MAKKSFPLSKVYGLLEPGPVVMVTTVRKGRPNIMTTGYRSSLRHRTGFGVAGSGRAERLRTCRAQLQKRIDFICERMEHAIMLGSRASRHFRQGRSLWVALNSARNSTAG
jgi:hypothetical protein